MHLFYPFSLPCVLFVVKEAAALRRFHHLAVQRRHNATLGQLLELPPQQRATALATLRAEAVEEEMKADTLAG